MNNLSGGTHSGNGDEWRGIAQGEPGVFLMVLALEVGIARTAGTHQAGINRSDKNIVLAYLCGHSLRETSQCELAAAIRREMGNADLAADGRNIYDASRALPDHSGQRGLHKE